MAITKRRSAEYYRHPDLVSASDFVWPLRFLIWYAVALTTPEAQWMVVARFFVSAKRKLSAQLRRKEETLTQDLAARNFYISKRAARFAEGVQNLRHFHFLAYRPETKLTGAAHLEQALRSGRGVILWVGSFCFASIIVKRVLFEAGYEVSHLSRWDHGYSLSRLGAALFNPIKTSVENRYLAERLVIGKDSPVGALVKLRRRLKSGKIVSITTGEGDRSDRLELSFLGGHIRLSRGPLRLSRDTGAPLLPVFFLRHERGAYEVIIGEDLSSVAERDRSALPSEQVEQSMLRYVRTLEPYVRQSPELWRNWADLK